MGLVSLAGPTHAAVLVGVVLVEAMVLYVAYGAVIARVGGAVTDALRNR